MIKSLLTLINYLAPNALKYLIIILVFAFWYFIPPTILVNTQDTINSNMFYPSYQESIIKPKSRSSYDVYGTPILLAPVTTSGSLPTVFDIVTRPARRDEEIINQKAEARLIAIFDAKEINCLAVNMYHEARGEGRIGMVAVGWVTINRRNSIHFPNTICKVVYQRSQFSWVSLGITGIYENEVFQRVKNAANFLYNNENNLHDYTRGAQYFLSYMPNPPSWSRQFAETFQYHRHTFYRQDY